MIAGMSGSDVRVPVTGAQQASAALIRGMSSVVPLAPDVDTSLNARDAVLVVEVVESAAAGAAPAQALPTAWARVRRMLGFG
jgi:hypothetical protein